MHLVLDGVEVILDLDCKYLCLIWRTYRRLLEEMLLASKIQLVLLFNNALCLVLPFRERKNFSKKNLILLIYKFSTDTKLYSFGNPSLGFIRKIFLQYCYKISMGYY